MEIPSEVDFLVMGAGVAGLRAAVELARHGEVLVVTKESLGESNTHYAQGGIAVALEGDQDIALHLEDTVSAGDGIVYRPAAEALVAEGPVRVAELMEWGARFDSADGELLRTREGAHSLARILHANGDATGAEISRSLVAFARAHKSIHFAEWTMVTGLVLADGRVIGADLASAGPMSGDHQPYRISARAVLIASGGAGQVYSETTNPAVATGDGIALAAQAGTPADRSWSAGLQGGAELADMEFYQFHPTALSLPGVPRFLLSEALRGEGAWLRNDKGERFMERYHAKLELAPRDVVARAIAREGMAAGKEAAAGSPQADGRKVYLDMRHVRGVNLGERFPGISAFLARHGLALDRDLIPVRPAAHYLMGGIRTDLAGRTSLKGLYAAGEAACTGVHGANRLASNSLLEGLVFGARAAQAMLDDGLPLVAAGAAESAPMPLAPEEDAHLEALIAELQTSMWAYAGLLRGNFGLLEGFASQAEFADGLKKLVRQGKGSRRLSEALALNRVANAILHAALARTESRGAHFRNDYPRRDDENFQKHSVFGADKKVAFEEW
ncbi:MAG: L-aspartate oxidase [Terracidiphilus sp.]|jgi:L-aspartate oxidase